MYVVDGGVACIDSSNNDFQCSYFFKNPYNKNPYNDGIIKNFEKDKSWIYQNNQSAPAKNNLTSDILIKQKQGT